MPLSAASGERPWATAIAAASGRFRSCPNLEDMVRDHWTPAASNFCGSVKGLL